MAALPAMNSRRRMRPLKDNAMGGRASHFAADLCAAIAACKLIRLSSDKSIHQCFHGDDVLLRAINGPHGDPDFHGRSGLVNGLRRADFRQRSDARLDEAPEAGMMPSAQMRRDDQFDRLSNRLLLGLAKQLLGVPAPRQDAAGRVDGESCARHHRLQMAKNLSIPSRFRRRVSDHTFCFPRRPLFDNRAGSYG